MKNWLNTLLIVILAVTFLISAFYLGSYFVESFQTKNLYNDLAALVQNATIPVPQVTTPVKPEDPDVQPTDPTVPTATEPSPWIEVTDPETGKPVQILPQYAQLYLMNNHLAGWMKIEGTNVNYPVMQTPASPDYYLHRDFGKAYNEHGCLYAREACDLQRPSDNVTIYGHNMRDGSMFGMLSKYKDHSFWREHNIITFNTLTEHHTYQIAYVFLTTASEGEGFPYHLFSDALDETHYNEFISACKALSLYDTGVNVQYGDKLITLSTCEYTQTNGRLVVVAKRIT